MIRFLLDGEVVAIPDADPSGTLLDHLRYRLRRTGTKEGCAEGDCGACTVLVGTLAGDEIVWRALNACILFLPMLDGKALMTIESLAETAGGPTPVQQMLAANGGSQCGFCTPGIVMSLHGRAIAARGSSELPVADLLAGNLCRCTGYGPILAAGEAIRPSRADDTAIIAKLRALQDDAAGGGHFADALASRDRLWWRPRDTEELAQILIDHPDARIVAGATDVALWVTKRRQVL